MKKTLIPKILAGMILFLSPSMAGAAVYPVTGSLPTAPVNLYSCGSGGCSAPTSMTSVTNIQGMLQHCAVGCQILNGAIIPTDGQSGFVPSGSSIGGQTPQNTQLSNFQGANGQVRLSGVNTRASGVDAQGLNTAMANSDTGSSIWPVNMNSPYAQNYSYGLGCNTNGISGEGCSATYNHSAYNMGDGYMGGSNTINISVTAPNQSTTTSTSVYSCQGPWNHQYCRWYTYP